MAIAQKPLDNTGPSPTTNCAAYLLEEMLPGEKADFVKFLHNASAASELSPDEPDYHLAEFLMYTQHVQYAITGGLAYVSDFQGNVERSISYKILIFVSRSWNLSYGSSNPDSTVSPIVVRIIR